MEEEDSMTTTLSDRPEPLYDARMGIALKLAADAFAHRVRKGSQVPYLTHLLGVAAIVMDYCGTEDQIIAAVLHDLLEDIEPDVILKCLAQYYAIPSTAEEVLRRLFGYEPIGIVLALSDTTRPGEKEDWAKRKRAYLANLRLERESVKIVAAADKIHNMRSLVREYDFLGDEVFRRFGDTTVHDHLWYYSQVTAAICNDFEHPILQLLRETYGDLVYVLEVECKAEMSKSCAWEP